jgi:hypothetical protein
LDHFNVPAAPASGKLSHRVPRSLQRSRRREVPGGAVGEPVIAPARRVPIRPNAPDPKEEMKMAELTTLEEKPTGSTASSS